jgi:hypothetical protein
LGYLFVITGAWDIFDTCFWESTQERDGIYFIVGLLGSFLCNDLLSPESIYYITAIRGRYHQQKQYKDHPDDDPFLDHCVCNTHPWVPAEDLISVQDEFVREVIHPAVKEFISPGEVYIVEIWNYFNAVILVPFFDLFQWIGLWNLIDYHWIWTEDDLTKIVVYLVVGYVIIAFALITGRFIPSDMEDSWKLGIPRSFGWRRKTKNFLKCCFAFIGFMFVWVGASTKWDLEQEEMTTYVMYFVISFFVMYLGTEVFSIDALFYVATLFTIKWRDFRGLRKEDEQDSIEYILDEDI